MSKRLKIIFSIGVLLLIAHGLEEYVTGFYDIDPQFLFVFKPLFSMTINQATFLTFQILLWIALVIFALLLINEKWRIRLMVIPGFFFVYEIHHVIEAIAKGGYYPGLVTAILLTFLGTGFWKELIKDWKSMHN